MADFPKTFRDSVLSIRDIMYTSDIGIIEKYDYSTQKADVSFVLKEKYNDGEIKSRPIVVNVPVVFPRSANASLTFPINKGDYVLLIFARRSLDRWLSRGGVEIPGSQRKFSINDALAIPGVYPFSEQSPADNNTDLLLRNGNVKLRLQGDGKLALGSSEEVIDLISDLIVKIKQLETIDTRGDTTAGFTNSSILDTVKNKFDSIKGSL